MARNEQPARSTVGAGVVFTVGIALVIGSPGIAGAQLLDRASSAARGSDDGGSQSRSDDRSSDSSDDDDDRGSSDGLLGSASRAARGGARTGGSGASSGGGWEGPTPSRARVSVPYSIAVAEVTVTSGDDAPAPVAARLELEGGYVLAGAGRIGAGARVELPWAFDVAARYSLFVEPREDGWDAVALGRIGLDWRAVDESSVVVRIGGALRHFQDGAGGLFGADVALGVDLFLGPPVIVSLELGAGFVGEAFVAQGRGSLGFLVGACELYVGYDFEGLWSGSIGVDLGGPMLGVRGWL